MSESRDLITDLLLNYRECVRAVWNGYFRHFPDAWHEFTPVERALFSGMVMVQAFYGPGMANAIASWIGVRPEFPPRGLRVVWARESRSGGASTWNWEETTIQGGKLTLSFIEFFDWRPDGIKDLEFVRARVRECEEVPSLVGADVLLPALACDYLARPEP